MSKHTPGPWEYRPAMNYIGYAIFPLGTLPSLAACERYGEVMTLTCFNFPGSTEANARIMAAAPELLEALEKIAALNPEEDSDSGYNEWGEAECFNKAQAIATAIIAKAKGE